MLIEKGRLERALRFSRTILAVAGVVVLVATSATPAIADQPPASPCADAALALAADASVDVDAGIDFACIGDVVSVEGKSTTGDHIAKQASVSGITFPSQCTAASLVEREIINSHQSAIGWCMYWGQRNSPVNGDWTVTTVANLTTNLYGWQHDFTSGFISDDYETAGYTTISGFTHLKREQAGLPPTSVDSTSWTSAHFDRVAGNLLQPEVNGVYSMHWDTISVVNTAKAFEMEFDQPQLATHRFLCNTVVDSGSSGFECRWPDGQEAVL